MSEKRSPSFTLAQIIFGVAVLFGLGGIIPALLDAESNAAVLVGVILVISVLYGVVVYHREILKRFGIKLEKGDEE